MRHYARRRRGHGSAAYLFAFLLLVLLVSALAARADENAPDWNVYPGEAVIDTLDGNPAESFAAGAWVLGRHHWVLETRDEERGAIVTGWRVVKHPLLKLAAGPTRARVAVGFQAVAPGRTQLRVQGGFASREPLGAMLPLAQSAGRKQCLEFVEEMRTRIAERRTGDGAGSGGAASAAESR